MPQREKLEEVRAWMIKSAHDLRAADVLSSLENPLRDVVVYHCQQAAEKALKGLLTWYDRPFSKTHSLVELIGTLTEIDPAFDALMDDAEDLSPMAWRYRYPADLLQPDEPECREALERARKIREFVSGRLPQEVIS
jgi:HEPN domain-containing protein